MIIFLLILFVLAAAYFAVSIFQTESPKVVNEFSETDHSVISDSNTVSENREIEADYRQSEEMEIPEYFGKWTGEYLMRGEKQEDDDGEYRAVAEIFVKTGGDGNILFWFEDLHTGKKLTEVTEIYGEYIITEDSLTFESMVQMGDYEAGIDPGFTLFENDGNFALKSLLFHTTPENSKIKIEKIK